MRLRSTFLVVLALGACRDQSEGPPRNPLRTDEVSLAKNRDNVAPAGSPFPTPATPGGLLPLRRVAIESELASGAACALDDTPGGPLLVAAAGDAIINHDGRIVHLKPAARNLNELMRGGRFVGNGLIVVIDREHQVEQVDEVRSWQATVRLERGRLAFTSFHHRWSCGG